MGPQWQKMKLCFGEYVDNCAPGAAGVKAHYFALLKFYHTVGHGEDRVIFANPDIFSGLNRGTALAHNNLSGARERAVRDFYAQALTVTVAT